MTHSKYKEQMLQTKSLTILQFDGSLTTRVSRLAGKISFSNISIESFKLLILADVFWYNVVKLHANVTQYILVGVKNIFNWYPWPRLIC